MPLRRDGFSNLLKFLPNTLSATNHRSMYGDGHTGTIRVSKREQRRRLGLVLGGPLVLRQGGVVLVVFFNTPRFGERSYNVPYFRLSETVAGPNERKN